MLNINTKINSFFKGHQRSVRVKKNIALSFVFKGFSILISLMLVPMTLNYLNATEYGIWLTLSSILTWIHFFDIGLGNGLRNKLTEALTFGDKTKAQIYVSTTFAILTLIVLIFFLIFICINPFLNWASILNTAPEIATELSKVVVIVFSFFCLQFVLKTVGIIFIAVQKPAFNDLLNVLGSGISLGIIYLLTLFTEGSLYNVAFVFSMAPAVVFVIAYFFIFYSKYKFLRPTIATVKFKYSNDLIGLGMKFFFIQIACLLVFTASNIIITQILEPTEVTTYNIAFKYFSIITMVFTIFLTPFWNAYTEAWLREDIAWIKNSIKRSLQIWGILIIVTIVMVLASNWVYKFWIGDSIVVPIGLTISCAVYVSIFNWNNIFAFFINGVGKLKISLLTTIIISLIYIPISILLTTKYGLTGSVLGMSVTLLIGAIFAPLQYNKLKNKKAYGIWNK
ncbi:MAG: lipopolysaccharide biosynthesis protein [Chitinophagaceae bacterium]